MKAIDFYVMQKINNMPLGMRPNTIEAILMFGGSITAGTSHDRVNKRRTLRAIREDGIVFKVTEVDQNGVVTDIKETSHLDLALGYLHAFELSYQENNDPIPENAPNQPIDL